MAPAAIRKRNAQAKEVAEHRPGKEEGKEKEEMAVHLLDPIGPAYETTFLEAIEPALEDLVTYSVRVAVNAGKINARMCVRRSGVPVICETEGG